MRQSAPYCERGETLRRHLVCGSGGTRAFLANTGAIIALRLADVFSFETVGGVSGGSLATLLAAEDTASTRMLDLAMDMDFSQLVTQSDTLGGYITGMLRRRAGRRKRLRQGLMKTEKLGAFAESMVKSWPKRYWTMAVAGDSQLLFTAGGVFEYKNGQKVLLSATPAPLSIAIRATCAIPGVLESVDFMGRELYDGALGPYGKCPAGMVRKHFSVRNCDIVACDLDHHQSRRNRVITRVGKIIAGNSKPTASRQTGNVGLIIRPTVTSMGSLEFVLSAHQKEQAILAGFAAALRSLAFARKINESRLVDGVRAAKNLEALRRLAVTL